MNDSNLLHQLPEGLRDLLPREAQRLERARRRLGDRFALWGYLPVSPPNVEYMDGFLAGNPHDAPQQLLKFEDRASGRLLACRADFTPQIARIASTVLDEYPLPWRLRYDGSVLRHPNDHTDADREMRQVGVELIGWAGVEADVELMAMLIDGLNDLSIQPLTIAVGHPGIFNGLTAAIALDPTQRGRLRDLLHTRNRSELGAWIKANDIQPAAGELIDRIGGGYGALGELDALFTLTEKMAQSKSIPGSAGLEEIREAIARLREAIDLLATHRLGAEIQIDPAELSAFEYHSGITFNVYHPDSARPVAGGGRYDRLLERFGKARPASGFAIDLQTAARLAQGLEEETATEMIVYNEGGANERPNALAVATRLRALEWRVIKRLDGGSFEEAEALAKAHGAYAIVRVGFEPNKMAFRGVKAQVDEKPIDVEAWLKSHEPTEKSECEKPTLQELAGE